MAKARYLYDVFISHAVEDKIPIGNELCRRLEEKNLKVWYSGRELSVGDGTTESIDRNLDQCRFGVVIISPTYLSKTTALSEFFLLLTKEKKSGQKVILPVLYDITPEQLASRSTLMAEMFAVRAERGLEHVTEKLYQEIHKQQAKDASMDLSSSRFSEVTKKRVHIFAAALLILIGCIAALRSFIHDAPAQRYIELVIKERIDDLQRKAEDDMQALIKTPSPRVATTNEIKKAYLDFLNSKTNDLNEYILYTNNERTHSKENVSTPLATDAGILTPLNLYDIACPKHYLILVMGEPVHEEKLVFYRSDAVSLRLEEFFEQPGYHNAKVYCDNPIRIVLTALILPETTATKRQMVTVTALRPMEAYTFINEEGRWLLESTR